MVSCNFLTWKLTYLYGETIVSLQGNGRFSTRILAFPYGEPNLMVYHLIMKGNCMETS